LKEKRVGAKWGGAALREVGIKNPQWPSKRRSGGGQKGIPCQVTIMGVTKKNPQLRKRKGGGLLTRVDKHCPTFEKKKGKERGWKGNIKELNYLWGGGLKKK